LVQPAALNRMTRIVPTTTKRRTISNLLARTGGERKGYTSLVSQRNQARWWGVCLGLLPSTAALEIQRLDLAIVGAGDVTERQRIDILDVHRSNGTVCQGHVTKAVRVLASRD
jgi:hypothetical protein